MNNPVDSICFVSFFTPQSVFSHLLLKEWANPIFHRHLHVYPEVTNVVSEFWQAAKYTNELPDEQLMPMWANWSTNSHQHFYVKEVAKLDNSRLVLLIHWVVYRGQEHAQVIFMHQILAGRYMIPSLEKKYILCTKF
jgi:hypothetical protein